MRLIDADAIADILCNLATEKWNKETGTSWANAYEEVMNMIEEQPTIDAVPVKNGHWEWDNELGANICSECGRPTYDYHDEYVGFVGSNVIALVSPYYCGYCGAKMDR